MRVAHAVAALVLAVIAASCFPAGGRPGHFIAESTVDLPDENPGDGICRARLRTDTYACTLRAAIMESNAHPDANTIRLRSGEYAVSHPVLPDRPEGSGGPLLITSAVRIAGEGAAATLVSGAMLSPRRTVFIVRGDAVVISGITIRDGGGVSHNGGGVHVHRDASLVLERVLITNNTAITYGAGIANEGAMTLLESTVSNNRVGVGRPELVPWGIGGGIFNDSTGELTIRGSTISGNTAGSSGGGIANRGRIYVDNSTISGNTAPENGEGGGGLMNDAARSARGTARLSSVTVTRNSSGGRQAGGLHSFGALHVTNSIIADNSHTAGGSPDCTHLPTRPLESGGYNLIGDLTGCAFTGTLTGHIEGDPRLSSLADHGGPTATHSLLPGSPAIDGGHPTSCPPTDQRGRPRTGRCDIGAFELVR